MYLVRFVRKDEMPDEEYFYHKLEDAEIHLHLFDEDTSALYKHIQLWEECGEVAVLLRQTKMG